MVFPRTWLLRPAFDPELKEYLLLAYLQRVRDRFAERKLYPHIEDIRLHLEELLTLRERRSRLSAELGRELRGFDPATGAAIHDPVDEAGILDPIDAVIDLALPGLQHIRKEGEDLKMNIASRIRFEPVGIQPLDTRSGWLILRTGADARVYTYGLSVLREAAEEQQYRSVVTHFVATYPLGLSCTYEHIKSDLVRRHPDRPTPATFVIEPEPGLPHIETVLPLGRQFIYSMLGPLAI